MLNSDKIKLRGLEERDLSKLVEWMNDKYIMESILRIVSTTESGTKKWYEGLNRDNSKIIFAIEEKSTGKFIGCIGLNGINYIDRKAEFYIYIGEVSARGNGYSIPAIKLIIEYAFNYLNLNKIFLNVREDNIIAIKSYEKAGFIKEGFFIEERYINGKYINMIRMALKKKRG